MSGLFRRPSYPAELAAAMALLASAASPTSGAAMVAQNQSQAYAAGTVGAKLRQVSSPTDNPWLADATGVSDTSAAMTSCNAAAASITIPAGTYKVTSNVTFTKPVTMLAGASLQVATGVTVAFNGGFSAGVWQCWTLLGTGAVTFDVSKTRTGFAEWWGAISNTNTAPIATANAIAINLAVATLPKTELMPADYYVSATIKHKAPNHWLMGQGCTYDAAVGTHSTRILMTDGSTHVLQLGPDANPGGIALFPLGVKATGLQVARTVAPVVASGCCSVRVQYVLEAFCDNVRADESMNGWEFNGTVSTRLFNTSAKRTSVGTGGTDSWKGYYANGSSGIAAGGNASLYIAYSHADDTRATVVNGNGFYFDGAYTDCFLSWCESVTCTVGVNVQGNSAVGLSLSNTDLHIVNCINDNFKFAGVLVNNVAEAGSVEIEGGYQGPAAGATAAIFVQNSPASVLIHGGQCVMGAAPTVQGIVISNANGVRVNGTQILECGTTCVGLSNANGCNIQPIIKNKSVTAGAGVQLNGTCVGNFVQPTMIGKASAFTFGIQVVGVADTKNEYSCTLIDSGAVSGGALNKLVRNGVQISATGLSGTNLVSGVMT